MTPARDALIAALRAALGPADHPLGLAVSGGGDSVALLRLAVDAGLQVAVATVDHGLRAEAAAEAEWVAELCRDLGVPHDTLRWQGWDGAGNLQDQARRARLALLAEWAMARGLGAVAMGHTQDDQAETLLMRLARRAGVDGLSGMAARRSHLGVVWLRPLLGVSRAALRDDLRARGQGWIDDPSNDALRFDRVKARHVLAALAPLGVDADVLSGVAARMAEARAALSVQTLAAARALAQVHFGDVVIDRAGFLGLPAEIRRRLLLGALVWVASAEYGPRAASVQALLGAIAAGRGGTLAGCRVTCSAGALRISREARAVADVAAPVDAVWDGRWRVTGPQINGLHLRALGAAGLAQCPGWRAAGLPRASALALPGVWRDACLVAAPLLTTDETWRAEPIGGPDAFFLSLLSH